MTREEWAPVVSYLSAAVGKPMARETAEVYFDLLSDLSAELVRQAARRAVCENRYSCLPPVGTIRALAVEAARPQAPTWPEAWALVCRAVGRYGLSRREQALASLPAAAARAADAIGWVALCDASEGASDTLRAQFRDAYGTLRERHERELLLPAPLKGEPKRLAEGIGLPLPDG